MISSSGEDICGVLFSGGLDSAVLVGRLARENAVVQPIYIRCGLHWEAAELAAAERYWRALPAADKRPLTILDLPLRDVYGSHWSITGQNPPTGESDDLEMFLPGRNLLLVSKAALWCQLNGVNRLAIGVLGTSPFEDASTPFFEQLQNLLPSLGAADVRLERPFASASKHDVIQMGARLPLHLTLSCITPNFGRQCGMCNKCAERAAAFEAVRRIAAATPLNPNRHSPSSNSSAEVP